MYGHHIYYNWVHKNIHSYYNVLYMLIEPANSSISASDLWGNRRQCWDEALIHCNTLEEHLPVEELIVIMKENGCVGHWGESQSRNARLQVCEMLEARSNAYKRWLSTLASQCCI